MAQSHDYSWAFLRQIDFQVNFNRASVLNAIGFWQLFSLFAWPSQWIHLGVSVPTFSINYPGWVARQKKEFILTQSDSYVKQHLIGDDGCLASCGQSAADSLSCKAYARGWCAMKVSSRQGKSISNEAGSRRLCGCLDLGDDWDQQCLEVSRAVT